MFSSRTGERREEIDQFEVGEETEGVLARQFLFFLNVIGKALLFSQRLSCERRCIMASLNLKFHACQTLDSIFFIP